MAIDRISGTRVDLMSIFVGGLGAGTCFLGACNALKSGDPSSFLVSSISLVVLLCVTLKLARRMAKDVAHPA